MRRFEKGAREVMSQLAFWVVMAYFVLAITNAFLFNLYGKQAHESAVRTASARASAITQVSQCFTAVKNGPVTRGFIDGQEALIANSLIGNQAALEVAPPNDPLRPVRVAAIVRLDRAERNVTQLRKLIRAATPTRAKCLQLAAMLKVDASRYTTRRN